jgi:RNA polymerase sigma-70 factor (ECF subfamily)
MGDGGQVDAIVSRHQGLVRAFFRRRCTSPEDAEDLAQEALCAIVASFPRFRGNSSPSTWVWAICRNVFSRYLYTKRRNERIARELCAAVKGDAGSGPGDDAAQALSSVLGRLRPAERRLYECHYGNGLSVSATARLLQRPEGTVKFQLFKLRERIKDLLGADGGRDG